MLYERPVAEARRGDGLDGLGACRDGERPVPDHDPWALPLAADAQITDESILQQIKRGA